MVIVEIFTAKRTGRPKPDTAQLINSVGTTGHHIVTVHDSAVVGLCQARQMQPTTVRVDHK